MTEWANRKRLSLQISHVENLDAFDRVNDVFRVGSQLGDALFKVEHFFGELSRFQTGGAQQLDGVFQKYFVGVDSLYRGEKRAAVKTDFVSRTQPIRSQVGCFCPFQARKKAGNME